MLNRRGSRHIPNSQRVFVCPNDALTNLTLSNGENTQTFLANAANGDIALFCADSRGIWSSINTDIWAAATHNEFATKQFFVGQKTLINGVPKLRKTHELAIDGLSVTKAASRLGVGHQQIVHSWVLPKDAAGNLLGGEFILGTVSDALLMPQYERASFQAIFTDAEAAAFATEADYQQAIVTKLVAEINNAKNPVYNYAGIQVYTAAPTTTTGAGLVVGTTVKDEQFSLYTPREAQQALIEKTVGATIDGSTIPQYLLELGSYNSVFRHEQDAGRIMDGYTFTNVVNQDLYSQYPTFAEPECFYTEYTIRGHYHIKTSAPNEQEHYQMFDVSIFVKETAAHTASTLLDTVFTSAPVNTLVVA